MLDGYGPIPPSMARRLVADGADSFHRVLVDPRDGAPLEIGRASYRLTKAHAPVAAAPRRQMLRSRAATTPRWTTMPTTSWPGPTAAPPGSPTSASRAANTTASNTRSAWTPSRCQQRPARRAGPHRPDATTPANTRTGNHPTGRTPTSQPPDGPDTPWVSLPRIRAGHPDLDLTAGPRPGSRLELPPDPFPDWAQFAVRDRSRAQTRTTMAGRRLPTDGYPKMSWSMPERNVNAAPIRGCSSRRSAAAAGPPGTATGAAGTRYRGPSRGPR